MIIDLAVRRRCFAEEIGAVANLSAALVDAAACWLHAAGWCSRRDPARVS